MISGLRARFEHWREKRDLCALLPRRGPELVQIGITERCNYCCLMCSAHSPLVPDLPPEGQRPQMPFPLFRGLLADLRQLGGTKQIDLVGIGEPLLHPESLEMAAAVKQAGFRLGLATNGSLLDEEKARRLAELGVDKLHVSINSGSEEVYRKVHPTARPEARQRILNSLAEMNAYCDQKALRRPRLALSTVVFKQTYLDLVGLVKSAAEVGATDVHFIPMGTVPGTQPLALDAAEWQEARKIIAEADQLARQHGLTTNAAGLFSSDRPDDSRDFYSRIRCYIGHTFSLIFADGQARFCCGCDRTLGNLNDHPFREIWRGKAYAEMRRLALALPQSKEPLARCNCFQACPHRAQNLATHEKVVSGR